MKICAIICEYNPFHNGHFYQLNAAREATGCDAVVCLMSGNFVQRGEGAILGKYARARHAALAGADAVLELPPVFASSPAELFAAGAIKLLNSVPQITSLCFGCESGRKEDFLRAADLLADEPEEISEKIKEGMRDGTSYARARAKAWEDTFPRGFLLSPNNILGIEYAKALKRSGKNIEIFPVRRIGKGYGDESLSENFSSAAAIRKALVCGGTNEVFSNLPPFVARELPRRTENRLETLEKYALLAKSPEEIRWVCDCGEGLENALQAAARNNVSGIAEALASKRYTASRLRRILLHNLLGISENFLRECLAAPRLYLQLLAVKKESKGVLSALSESNFPLLIRAGDREKLDGTAKECWKNNRFADEIFALARRLPPEKRTIFIE